MLYPDNPDHEKAVSYIDLLDNSLYIKHIEKRDEKGKIINKAHYHCILRYDNPTWLSVILSELGLSESDAHLFHSYKDFKKGHKQQFKSLEDYVSYLDHTLNDEKEDKYSIDDFKGGLKGWASSILLNRDTEKHILLLELVDFINKYNLDHFPESMHYQFDDWYRICCAAGYGNLFYKEWYKMRDILKRYVNS